MRKTKNMMYFVYRFWEVEDKHIRLILVVEDFDSFSEQFLIVSNMLSKFRLDQKVELIQVETGGERPKPETMERFNRMSPNPMVKHRRQKVVCINLFTINEFLCFLRRKDGFVLVN